MIDLTLTQALNKLNSREISATELTRAHLARIEQLNPELNAYITVTAERALNDAAAADARYAVNNALPLHEGLVRNARHPVDGRVQDAGKLCSRIRIHRIPELD